MPVNDIGFWHDLREPTRGTVQRLLIAKKAIETNGDAGRHIDLALELATRVNSMFEKMIEFHRSGKCDLAEVDLNQVVRTAVQNVQHILGEAEICIEDRLPTIISDECSLVRVVQNLLDNCAKYGGERLRIAIGHKSTGLFVQDNGPGIPVDRQEEAFVAFRQIDKTKGGVGMGLPLCRKLLKGVGGDIWIDKTFAEGARFIVSYYTAIGEDSNARILGNIGPHNRGQ